MMTKRKTKRKVSNRGLLDYPLRKVVSRSSTAGGNPNTNPPRTWFKLECGHCVVLPGRFVERKSLRCDECPKKT
jgi:hypothetical protein